jgi:predicted ATPase
MIKHARISNYKSLGDVAVDLDPVTVLIGRSGTGKTTFVEALRFLRDYVAYRGENAVPQYGGWQRVLSATAPRPMAVSFTVKFDAPGVREDYEYTLTFQQHPQQPHLHAPPVLRGEKLALGGRVLFHHDGGQWLHPPGAIPPFPEEPGVLRPCEAGRVLKLAC